MKTVLACEAHVGCVKCSTVSESGKWLVTGGTDETIRIFDLNTRLEFGALHRHKGTISCVEFFADSHLLSGGEDGKIFLWSCDKWVCSSKLKGHEGSVLGLSVHPSGRVALSIGADKTLKLWDLTTGRLALSTDLDQVCRLVAWNPSGTSYVLVSDSSIAVYNTEGAMTRNIKPQSKVLSVSFITDILLGSGGEDGNVRVLDVESGECVQELTGHKTRIRGMAVCRQEETKTNQKGEVDSNDDDNDEFADEGEGDSEFDVSDDSDTTSPKNISTSKPIKTTGPLLASCSSDGKICMWGFQNKNGVMKMLTEPVHTAQNNNSRMTTMCSSKPLIKRSSTVRGESSSTKKKSDKHNSQLNAADADKQVSKKRKSDRGDVSTKGGKQNRREEKKVFDKKDKKPFEKKTVDEGKPDKRHPGTIGFFTKSDTKTKKRKTRRGGKKRREATQDPDVIAANMEMFQSR